MIYQQTLAYIYSQLPMFSRIGASAFKADLNNTILLCEYLGNPQTKFRSVHVAGTNGKGSTSHMLAAIFQSAGYKTGLYTSPHLKDFRERIKVDGEMIPENYVVDFITRLKPLIEEASPSFFEITVAMAFEYFVQQQVDIAIIEVGLGGRLDSTNIITPELSIITNISWDHMNMLGDTLEMIAAEKAGIIKPGIPVIIGDHQPAVAKVFEEKASRENAAIYFASEQRFVADWKFEHRMLIAEVTLSHTDEKAFYPLDLTGIYQTKNLVTVLEAVKLLQLSGWVIPDSTVHHALQHVKKLTGLHGRWETIHEHPRVILDVGHNEDGIKAIADQLELTTYHHLRIVIGMVKDKEVDKVLSYLPKTATYYFTKAQIPRALPEDELLEKGKAAGMEGQSYPDVNTALKTALSHADKDDVILVCGSVFVVGEVGPLTGLING
ncbi:MAG: folylpolyglutamate synthase/dihydrofolate synthase family protein [Chitinophagaceae bacterium]